MEEGKERRWMSRWKDKKMAGRKKRNEGGKMYKLDGRKKRGMGGMKDGFIGGRRRGWREAARKDE